METQATDPNIPTVPAPEMAPPGFKSGGDDTWKTALGDAIKSRDSVKKQNQDLAAKVALYEAAEAERTASAAKQQEQQQRERLEQEGKYKEALAVTEKKWADELEASRKTAFRKLVPTSIKAAASKIENLSRDAIDDLPNLLAGRVDLDYRTGDVVVRGDDGKPLLDDKLNPVSVDDFVRTFVSGKPYLLIDGMPRSHGGANGAGAQKGWTYDDALENPALMRQLEKEAPEALKKAQADYYSPRNLKSRVKANK